MMIPAGCSFEAIDAAGVKGKHPLQVLAALAAHRQRASWQALLIIGASPPSWVLGWEATCRPGCWRLLNLMKSAGIHEQNVLPGLTNRSLGRIADRIFTSFRNRSVIFPGPKAVLVGTPRKQHLQGVPLPPPARPFTVLISGGSLGSHQINCAVIDALHDLAARQDELRSYIRRAPRPGSGQGSVRERGFTAERFPLSSTWRRHYRRPI